MRSEIFVAQSREIVCSGDHTKGFVRQRWVSSYVAFGYEKFLVAEYFRINNSMPYAQIYPGPGAWIKLLKKGNKK